MSFIPTVGAFGIICCADALLYNWRRKDSWVHRYGPACSVGFLLLLKGIPAISSGHFFRRITLLMLWNIRAEVRRRRDCGMRIWRSSALGRQKERRETEREC